MPVRGDESDQVLDELVGPLAAGFRVGQGLDAVSRELLERMGGRIWVESSGSGGSTFFAELPVAAA